MEYVEGLDVTKALLTPVEGVLMEAQNGAKI
jgi:hypothetical protein